MTFCHGPMHCLMNAGKAKHLKFQSPENRGSIFVKAFVIYRLRLLCRMRRQEKYAELNERCPPELLTGIN